MNDFIYQRVSIRKFQDRPVEPEKVEQILRAAMAAPSARNQQPWHFYVVSNREKLQALSGASPYAGCCAKAPVAIVPAYDKACAVPDYVQVDMSIATENLWLALYSLGLGGVWLGIAPVEERMRAVEAILHMPASQRAFAVFPLGYPAETRKGEDRFRPERIHHVN